LAENAKTSDLGEILSELKSQKKDVSPEEREKLSVTDAVKFADEASTSLEK